MSDHVHPAFHQLRDRLIGALEADQIDAGTVASYVGALAKGDTHTQHELPPDLIDTLRRTAWLMFSRSVDLDGRWIAMAPMYLAFARAGQMSWADIFHELQTLEAHATDHGGWEAISTRHGGELADWVARGLSSVGIDDTRHEALGRAAEDRLKNAILNGDWEAVPLPGPDADGARGALSLLEPEAAHRIYALWMTAEAHMGSARWAEAITALDEAAGLGPEVFETFVRRARARFGSEDRTRAGADLERALALHPTCASARAMRAELRAVIRDMEGSLADWSVAIQVAPHEIAYRVGRAYTHLAMGRLGEALADLDAAVKAAPDDTTPLYNRADILVRMGRLDDALADYDTVLDKAEDDPQALLNRGTVLMMQQRHGLAVDDFRRVTELRPLHAMGWAKRAAAHLSTGAAWACWLDALTAMALAEWDWPHRDRVEQMVHAAISAIGAGHDAEGCTEALEQRAKLLRERATTHQQITFADLIDTHLPTEGLAFHLVRMNLYLVHKRWEQVTKAAHDALAVADDNLAARLALVQVHLHTGKPQKGLELADEMLHHTHDLPVADQFALHLCRGRLLSTLQRFDHAVESMEQALKVDPGRADVQFYRGVNLDLAGRQQEAIEAYTASIELDDTFAAAWFNRACEHAVLGQKEPALRDLERACTLEPKWATAARTDSYFSSLHGDDAFQQLVDRFHPVHAPS